ncbi:hypothetical protein G7046_g7790 [Stylonectria norvegica]|nr:hypothetical protein G7046_g7790 [Stylonectria norvegica]
MDWRQWPSTRASGPFQRATEAPVHRGSLVPWIDAIGRLGWLVWLVWLVWLHVPYLTWAVTLAANITTTNHYVPATTPQTSRPQRSTRRQDPRPELRGASATAATEGSGLFVLGRVALDPGLRHHSRRRQRLDASQRTSLQQARLDAETRANRVPMLRETLPLAAAPFKVGSLAEYVRLDSAGLEDGSICTSYYIRTSTSCDYITLNPPSSLPTPAPLRVHDNSTPQRDPELMTPDCEVGPSCSVGISHRHRGHVSV